MDDEHYIDGDHNGGVFNHYNHNSYGYCYQSPVRYIDPNGKQTDAVMFDVTNNTTEINKKEARLVSASFNFKNYSNSFQVMCHGNPSFMRDVCIKGNKAGEIDGPNTFNERFKDDNKWQTGKETKGFNLILLSCNTGRGKNSVASKISKGNTKINVIAPTRQMWADSFWGYAGVYGKTDEGEKNLNDPGYWIVYQKGIAVSAYDATWEPGSPTAGHEVKLSDVPSSHYNGVIGIKETKKVEKEIKKVEKEIKKK
jgi:hypothetical protein